MYNIVAWNLPLQHDVFSRVHDAAYIYLLTYNCSSYVITAQQQSAVSANCCSNTKYSVFHFAKVSMLVCQL